MNNKLRAYFIVGITFFSFLFVVDELEASSMLCIYFGCSDAYCSIARCNPNPVTCAEGEYGGNRGFGEGTTCCLNQCCPSGNYDCCSSVYDCCCPVETGCDATTCYTCTLPDCSGDYPNTSCDTTNGGTCTETTKSCDRYDDCDEKCGERERTCYSDPTCTAACTVAGHKFYSSEPSVSTSINSITKYIYADCSDADKCYRCDTGCGSCANNGGTYTDNSNQPTNTYTAGTCTYTNSLCETSDKYCYHACPEPTCKYLYSQTGVGTWLDGGCPGGPNDPTCVQVTMPVNVPVPNGDDIFPEYPAPLKSGDSYIDYTCSQEEVLTCHLPNADPKVTDVEGSVIPGPNDSIKGYSMDRFTGKFLNNPVQVTAQYSDADGSDDIIALYVWWSDSSTKNYPTPTEVYQGNTLNGQTYNEQNFGFMIARSYNSTSWDNARVYIPDFSVNPYTWVYIGDKNSTNLAIDNSENISTTNDPDFILINDINITPSGNNVSLDLDMNFIHEDVFSTNVATFVTSRDYNLWGSVNDRIGHLPFNVPYYQNNYPNTAYHILDSGNDAWEDKGNDWYVDILDPTGDIVNKVTDSNHEQVTVEVSAEDNHAGNPSGLSYVRLDACKSGDDPILPLTYDSDGDGTPESTSQYIPIDCDDVPAGGFAVSDITTGNSLLGDVGGYPGNPLDVNTFAESAVVGLGGNKEGSLTFYLTVMDMAGNSNIDNQAIAIYLLEQWAIVEDALVFGSESAISMTRTLDDSTGTFGASTALSRLRNLEEYDFTNQALLGKFPELYEGLKSLINYSANHSFKATGYSGQPMDSASAYGELRDAYGNKSNNPDFEELSLGSGVSTIIGAGINGGSLRDLDNDGTPECTKEYCIWTWEAGDPTHKLVFDDGFECNGKGLIIANGNVDITPNFITNSNADPENACIILANGNITIKTTDIGDQNPEDGYNNYDLVEAFLIANGYIEIEKVTTADPPNDRGLFVEGGLVGFTPEDQTNSSVLNRREIYYANMGQYPVLVVQGNSRYGMLGRTLFGSQIDIYRSLQGFKPY